MKGIVITPEVWQFLPEDPKELRTEISRDGELLIKCEVISPPSMAAKTRPPVMVNGVPFGGGTTPGRTALFLVPAELVPLLLRAAKDAAIAARSKPVTEASPGASQPVAEPGPKATVTS